MANATMTSLSALGEVMASLTLTFAAELSKARRGDPRAIHRARTTSRRLREVLPMAEIAAPRSGADRARRDIRKIARLLGPVRELDVAIAEFAQAAEIAPWDAAVVTTMERQLAAERARQFRDLATKLHGPDLDRLRARLEAIAADVATDLTPRLADRALARRLRRRATRLIGAIEAAGTLYIPEQLHAVRIAAKKLRYGLELVQESAGLPVASLLSSLKRVQDGLGRLHDVEVLASKIRELAGAASERTAAKSKPIILGLERACREAHANFLAKRAGLLLVARRTTTEVAPALMGRGLPMVKAKLPPVRDVERAGRHRELK